MAPSAAAALLGYAAVAVFLPARPAAAARVMAGETSLAVAARADEAAPNAAASMATGKEDGVGSPMVLKCQAWDDYRNERWQLFFAQFERMRETSVIVQRHVLAGHSVLITRSVLPNRSLGSPSTPSWWLRSLQEVSRDAARAGCHEWLDWHRDITAQHYAAANMDKLLALATLARYSDPSTCRTEFAGYATYGFSVSRPRTGKPAVHVTVIAPSGAAQNFTMLIPGSEYAVEVEASQPHCNRRVITQLLLLPWTRFMQWRSGYLAPLGRAVRAHLERGSVEAEEEVRGRIALARITLELLVESYTTEWRGQRTDVFDCGVTTRLGRTLQRHVQQQWEHGWVDDSLESAAAMLALHDAVRLRSGPGRRRADASERRSVQEMGGSPSAAGPRHAGAA